jgi:magnesium-transporting ATPase (P-type)
LCHSFFTIKGAPDILIERCTRILGPDRKVKLLDEATCTAVKQLKDRWSSEGKRVILLARKVLSKDSILPHPLSQEFEAQMLRDARTNLTLVGLVGMIDPPRPEIPEVMGILRRAQIRVLMVCSTLYCISNLSPNATYRSLATSESGLTALAIARQCGLVTTDSVHDVSALVRFGSSDEKCAETPQSALLVSGANVMSLNDHQWEQLCRYSEIVFSRTTPDQKLRIVREFQARGETVAMTGDGVNDAPALKAADIGISLASGSDVAIEASDMVLLDSFAVIVEAVRYGRVVFDNLKKTIAYLLPAGSFSEFWPVFANLVFGIPQILSSILMIIIW